MALTKYFYLVSVFMKVEIGDFRPIFNISVFRKIFEKLIFKQFLRYSLFEMTYTINNMVHKGSFDY